MTPRSSPAHYAGQSAASPPTTCSATGFEFDEPVILPHGQCSPVDVGTAVQKASSAVFTFANRPANHAASWKATPVLATSTKRRRSSVPPARAGKMSYDYVARTLRMTGDANGAASHGRRNPRLRSQSTTSAPSSVRSFRVRGPSRSRFPRTGCAAMARGRRAAPLPPLRDGAGLEGSATEFAERYKTRQVVKDLGPVDRERSGRRASRPEHSAGKT